MTEKDKNHIVVKTIDNRTVTLTTSFIVRVEPVTFLMAQWDTTAWKNYHTKECEKQTRTCWFMARGNQYFAMSQEIQHSFDSRQGDVLKYQVYKEVHQE